MFMSMSIYCCCNHAPNYGTGQYGGLCQHVSINTTMITAG